MAAPPPQQQQQYQQAQPPPGPEVNLLMPGSLKRVPRWYQNGPFRYNLRFLIGLLPGVLLLFTVAGRRMIAFVSLGGIGIMLVRGAELPQLSMFLTLGHLFLLEMVNVYCMMPLVWQSVLNTPLFAVFHFFIAVAGIWWCLQDEEFKRQDPRFVILAERVLFYLAPIATVTTVSWVGGMLFGRYAITLIVSLAGILAISLYVVPLQSSLTKPQTPTDVGLIQHRFVVWVYLALQLLVSPVLYSTLNYTGSLPSLLGLLVLVTLNPFLLTLLEAQGLFHWTSLPPAVVKTLRWTTGTGLLGLLSLLVLTQHTSSTHLPMLLVPTLFTQLYLISSAAFTDHTHTTTPIIVMGAALGLLYSLSFYLLPWTISHNFSFLSLPLSVVQFLLWCLAMATVVIATIWKRRPLQLLVIYNAAFVLCEYLLSWDGVYPEFVSMVTTATAAVMFWRLYSINVLPSNSALLSVCLHLTKLSLLLPSSHPHTLTTSTLVTTIAIFIVSYSLLRVLLFDDQGQSSSSQLLVYSGLLCIGLLLSIDTVLTPLWAAATHREPSGANLVAMALATVGVFILYGLRGAKDKASLLTVLPHGLFVMAALIAALQPEFNMGELLESFFIAASDASDVSEEMYLAAWGNLLSWVTLYMAVFTLVLLLYLTPLTVLSTTFLGSLIGLLTAISFVHYPPASLLGMLYATLLGVGGAIFGRVFVASKETRSLLDTVLFGVLLVTFSLLYWTEWSHLPRQHIPWKPFLDYYALPSTKVFSFLSLTLAVAFRVKMHLKGGQTYLPVIGNLFCLFFFLFATFHPFVEQLEVSVLLTSCIFLLAQPDHFLIPKTTTIFLAPSLVLSVTLLYIISGTTVINLMIHMARQNQSLLVVLRVVELVCLLATVPGQGLFLHHLWSGSPLNLSFFFTFLYISPSAALPQFSSSVASSALGGIGVLSFCLLIVGDYSNIKTF